MKAKDVKGLSDSELDDLIMRGIDEQEKAWPNTEADQHGQNVVQMAKEEKALRSERGEHESGADVRKVAESAPNEALHVAEPGVVQEGATRPRNVTGDARNDLAAQANEGLPGIVAGAAKDTPEFRNEEPSGGRPTQPAPKPAKK